MIRQQGQGDKGAGGGGVDTAAGMSFCTVAGVVMGQNVRRADNGRFFNANVVGVWNKGLVV